MMRVLVSFLACIAVCFAAVRLTRFRDCGSKGGTINYLEAEGCHDATCAAARPGASYTVRVSFTATVEITQTVTALYGSMFSMGNFIAFGVTPSDICGHGVACPVHPGDTVAYEMSLQCPKNQTAAKLLSKWELKDGHGTDILCFVLPIEIQV